MSTFPSTPSNNTTAVVNGITYLYDETFSAWKRLPTSVIQVVDNTSRGMATQALSFSADASDLATAANEFAAAAYALANIANPTSAYNQANTAFAQANASTASATAAFAQANAAFSASNTFITLVEGVNTYQNTTISAVNDNAQAAFNAANTASSAASGALNLTTGGTVAGNTAFTNLVTFQETTDIMVTKTGATGTVVHDTTGASVFYHTSVSASFTANFTNVPTTNDRAFVVTLVIVQGATPYVPSAVQIEGSAQTIKWVNNITPAGVASKTEVYSFSLIRTGSAWVVLGQVATYG